MFWGREAKTLGRKTVTGAARMNSVSSEYQAPPLDETEPVNNRSAVIVIGGPPIMGSDKNVIDKI